jgi:hypothetical protein
MASTTGETRIPLSVDLLGRRSLGGALAASHADAERTAELTAQVGEDRAVLAAVTQERP